MSAKNYTAVYRPDYRDTFQVLAAAGRLENYKTQCIVRTVIAAIGVAVFAVNIAGDVTRTFNYIGLALCVILAASGWIMALSRQKQTVTAFCESEWTVTVTDEFILAAKDGGEERQVPLDGTAKAYLAENAALICLDMGEVMVLPFSSFGDDKDAVKNIINTRFHLLHTADK